MGSPMSGRRRPSTTPAPSPAGEQGPKRMRQAGLGGGPSELLPSGGVEMGSSSSDPAMLVHNPTVLEEDVLDCGVCYLPLKPPIFQCPVGHALCSPCSEKLKHTRKCHQCRAAMPGGYQRCHALERVVDSIVCGPCPHVPYGCDTSRLVYHARDAHILQCPHAPCHCPGDGCSFTGSVATLIEHLTAAHSWPCTAETSAGDSFGVDLRVGFNFLTAVRGAAKYLLLLDMASTPLFHMISAVWIRSVPAVAGTSAAPVTVDTTCELELTTIKNDRSQFRLQCTTPSNCLPDPNASFHRFFFSNHFGGSGRVRYFQKNKAIVRVKVKAVIYIDSSSETSL